MRRLADTKFAAAPLQVAKPSELMAHLPADFVAAMDEDLAIPAAIAALHETVRAGNSSLDAEDLEATAQALVQVQAMTEVLGINPISWKAAGAANGSDSAKDQALAELVVGLISERDAARAAKDFARSDAIRDQLKAAGIVLEDAADGTHWSVN
jgi:cysteinyl-tRNA synthetase